MYGNRDMGYARRARGQSSSPSDRSESYNLLTQDSSGDELPILRRSDEGSPSRKSADYETAISSAGFGRFHYWLLFVCGWANASDAVEILCISFILPAATCDFSLTSEDKGWLSAILFIGMLIGGYIWGSVGDVLGRRKTLIIAMVVNAVFGIGSSLVQQKWQFFVMRFFSGLGVGGSIPLVWTYFGEFQCKSRRGRMLSALAAFWMIGNVTVAALAWAIIPYQLGTANDAEFKFNSWRIFVTVCGIPAVLVTIALVFLPESPKFLLSTGRESDALKIFRKIFMQNTGKHAADYPINHIKVENRPGSSSAGSTQSSLNVILSNTFELFKKPLLWVNLMMLYISFSIQFGYYGLWLWFPELFNKLDIYYKDHPNATVSVCEVTDYKPPNSVNDLGDCDSSVGNEVFLNSFLISIAALPGNIWTMIHMDKLGRKFFVVFSMVLSGGCVFFIYLVTSKAANLALSCAFGFVSVMGFNALDCLGIELFPTHVRSTAMAVNLAVARLGAITGNVVFGSLIETSCAIPILMVASLLLSGGLLSIKLPNTSNAALA